MRNGASAVKRVDGAGMCGATLVVRVGGRPSRANNQGRVVAAVGAGVARLAEADLELAVAALSVLTLVVAATPRRPKPLTRVAQAD